MEANPILPTSTEEDTSSDKKESRSRKRKKAEDLGSFLVEPKSKEKSLDKNKQPAMRAWHLPASAVRGPKLEEKPSGKPVERDQISLAETDKAPELDGEAPIEHLSRVEHEAVTKALAQSRQEAVTKELSDAAPDSTAAHQAEAAQLFLTELGDSADGVKALHAVEDAQELAIPDAAYEAATNPEELFDEADIETPLNMIDMASPTEGEINLTGPDTEADPDPQAASPTPMGGAGGGRSGAGNNGGSHGGGGRGSGNGGSPTPGPSGPHGSGGGPTQPFTPLGAAAAPNVVTAPTRAGHDTLISADDAYYYERKALSRGLLVGGIVGYLLGRRRGRIKTEKKLLPVQKKLEKEVENLQETLLFQETAVRQAVKERDEVRGRLTYGKREEQPAPASEVLKQPARTVAAEAHQLHGAKVPLERIGQVLIAAESLLPKTQVRSESADRPVAERDGVTMPERKQTVRAQAVEQRALTMDRTELLELSERIVVDGASLRQVYETHLVGEQGLRRIVAEHLRGGDVKRVLRRELVEREIDFERDPALRDRARASVSSGAGRGALTSLLEEAGAVAVIAGMDGEKPAGKKATAKTKQSAAESRHMSRRAVADISMIGVIIILLGLVIFITITGH